MLAPTLEGTTLIERPLAGGESIGAGPAGLDWRPWGIGGSDIGAILGLSSYRSAIDVWLDKTGATSAKPSSALPMRLGNFLEPFVVQEYERLTSNRTRRQDDALHHPDYPELFGHVDRIATLAGDDQRDIVLECKTCSAFRANEWGPAWSDQIPAEYLAQCLWYLGLTECEEAHLAVLLGNTDLRVYRIRRDRDVERHMFELAHRFWVEHVLTKQPPAPKTRAQAQSLHPVTATGLSKQARAKDVEAIKRKHKLEAQMREMQEEIEQIKDGVAVSLGPAEALTWRGRTIATWRMGSGTARLDAERLKRERPDVVDHYMVRGPAVRRLHFNTNSQSTAPTEADQ